MSWALFLIGESERLSETSIGMSLMLSRLSSDDRPFRGHSDRIHRLTATSFFDSVNLQKLFRQEVQGIQSLFGVSRQDDDNQSELAVCGTVFAFWIRQRDATASHVSNVMLMLHRAESAMDELLLPTRSYTE